MKPHHLSIKRTVTYIVIIMFTHHKILKLLNRGQRNKNVDDQSLPQVDFNTVYISNDYE
jgi:hypothetical protein